MFGEQRGEAALARLPRQGEILVRIAAPSGARLCDVLGEGIAAAALDFQRHIEREAVAVAVKRDAVGRRSRRQGDGGRHRHRQSLRGLTVEPQRQ